MADNHLDQMNQIWEKFTAALRLYLFLLLSPDVPSVCQKLTDGCKFNLLAKCNRFPDVAMALLNNSNSGLIHLMFSLINHISSSQCSVYRCIKSNSKCCHFTSCTPLFVNAYFCVSGSLRCCQCSLHMDPIHYLQKKPDSCSINSRGNMTKISTANLAIQVAFN